MGNVLNCPENVSTLWQSMYHPFAKKYEAFGDSREEAIDNLMQICIENNLDEIKTTRTNKNETIYYCGVSKQGKRYNGVFIGFRKNRNQSLFAWKQNGGTNGSASGLRFLFGRRTKYRNGQT